MTALSARLASIACVEGTFTLPNGTQVERYLDEFRMASDPELLRDVCRGLAERIPEQIDVIAGLELGGIPLAVALSAETGLPLAFLRRAPKAYGSRRMIEGADLAGRRVLLVGDVARTGSQLLGMARVVRRAGARCDDAACVVERALGARQLLAKDGVGLHSLLHESELSTHVAIGAAW